MTLSRPCEPAFTSAPPIRAGRPLPLCEPDGRYLTTIRAEECLRAAKVVMAALLFGLAVTLGTAAIEKSGFESGVRAWQPAAYDVRRDW